MIKHASTRTSARLTVIPALLMSFAAQATIVDWTNTFLLQGVGFDNPLVRVGFNPQPEPPAAGYHPPEPGMTDPTAPVFTLFDQVDPAFRILFGIGGSEPLYITWDDTAPGRSGEYSFNVTNRDASTAYVVSFTLSTSTGGVPDPLSWYGFNPQPEPPALGDMAGAIGFDFNFTSMSDVSLQLRVQDVTGAPVAFSVVPVPASLWLFGVGLVGLFGVARSGRS